MDSPKKDIRDGGGWPVEPAEQLRVFTLAMESSLSATGIADTEGRLVYVNDALVQMWGYEDPDELIGRLVVEHFEGDTIHQTLAALRSKRSVQGVDLGRRRDGSLIQVQFTATILADSEGNPAYLYGSFMDVTEQHRLQIQLQERDERFRSLMGAIPGMVYSARSDWSVQYMSDHCTSLTGYPAAEFTSGERNWLDLVHPDDKALLLEGSEPSGDGMVPVDQEYRIRNAGGDIVWVRDVKTLEITDGEVQGVTGFVSNITVRKRMEEQLAQADRLATVGLMAAGVAHEMNNPLSVMLGYAELVEERIDRVPSDIRKHLAELHKPLRAISKTGRRCKRIVEDLLSFGEPGHRGQEAVNLSEVLRAAVELVELQVRESGITLRSELDGQQRVAGNSHQLKLVFSNLVLNALQSMPDGGELRVGVWIEPGESGEHDWVRADVADTGVGIPRATLRRIFDPFFTTKPVGEGTGLGLSIVYGIVDQHGGRVEVESEPGQGTTFQVWLPLA